MKHFKRVISMMLVVVMCIAALPANVFAWSSMSHANSADIILMELQRMENRRRDRRAGVTIFAYGKEDTSKTPYTYLIPEEFEDAIMSYPDAFRAGSLGPDFYPDIIVGQMMTHPYDARKTMGSGEWVKLLVESVNCLSIPAVFAISVICFISVVTCLVMILSTPSPAEHIQA